MRLFLRDHLKKNDLSIPTLQCFENKIHTEFEVGVKNNQTSRYFQRTIK